jgi:hypothetical protein
LDTTLVEEEDTDQLLTDIAEEFINVEAEGEGNNNSWAEEEFLKIIPDENHHNGCLMHA